MWQCTVVVGSALLHTLLIHWNYCPRTVTENVFNKLKLDSYNAPMLPTWITRCDKTDWSWTGQHSAVISGKALTLPTADTHSTLSTCVCSVLKAKHEWRCQYTTSVNGYTYLFALVLRRFGILETSLVFAASFASPLEAVVCSTRRPVRLVDAMAFPASSPLFPVDITPWGLNKTNNDWLRLEVHTDVVMAKFYVSVT